MVILFLDGKVQSWSDGHPFYIINLVQSFPRSQQGAVLRNNRLIPILVRKRKCIGRAKVNLEKRNKEGRHALPGSKFHFNFTVIKTLR